MSRIDALIAEHSCRYCGRLFADAERQFLGEIDMGMRQLVHVIGVSSLAAGHKALVPALLQALKEQDAEDILVICGGVIPSGDYDWLKQAGVSGIYGPGTHIPAAAAEILELVAKSRRDAAA